MRTTRATLFVNRVSDSGLGRNGGGVGIGLGERRGKPWEVL